MFDSENRIHFWCNKLINKYCECQRSQNYTFQPFSTTGHEGTSFCQVLGPLINLNTPRALLELHSVNWEVCKHEWLFIDFQYISDVELIKRNYTISIEI